MASISSKEEQPAPRISTLKARCPSPSSDFFPDDDDTTTKLAQEKIPSETISKDGRELRLDGPIADPLVQLPSLPSPLPPPHPEFIHCMPPDPPTYRKFSVFTAGSIEMGKAIQWQSCLSSLLSHLPITVLNPRRGAWIKAASQEAKDKDFRIQVEWELSALEQADVICFFFDVRTRSPVTLLELGLWAGSGKIVVCCGDQYWRQGNVIMVCDRYGIPMVNSMGALVPAIEGMLVEKGMRLDGKGDLVGENVHVPKTLPQKKADMHMEILRLRREVEELQAELGKAKAEEGS